MAVPNTSPVKSAMRTLDVIEYVGVRRQGATAQELAVALEIPVSSLSYLLSTLCDRHYLRREGRLYLPGTKLEGFWIPDGPQSLEVRAAPVLKSVRHQLNETVSLMVRDGWDAVILLTESGEQALRYAIETGERKALHALAGGKAILAQLGEDELDSYFASGVRQKFTEHTITDEHDLRREIIRARETGFAEAREESTMGICSIAAVAGARWDTQLWSLSVAVPAVRFTDELREQARQVLHRAVSSLSDCAASTAGAA